jgi:anti-sigma B factor antagonist
MRIAIDTQEGITTIALDGDLDGASAPAAQQQIMAHATEGARVLLDMSNVPYMSSAGVRMLLSTYRQLSSNGGKIVLVGLAEEVQDTLSVTGFLNFFQVADALEAGRAALA